MVEATPPVGQAGEYYGDARGVCSFIQVVLQGNTLGSDGFRSIKTSIPLLFSCIPLHKLFRHVMNSTRVDRSYVQTGHDTTLVEFKMYNASLLI
jgi:hypothetical protein